MTDTEDLTGFDAELRALAKRLMPPGEAPFPGRDWHEHSLFTVMQTYAAIKSDRPKADLLAACERLGRLHADDYATRFAAEAAAS